MLPEQARSERERVGRQAWPRVVQQLERDARVRDVAICAGLQEGKSTVLVATHSRVYIVTAGKDQARRVTSYPVARVFLVERTQQDPDAARCEVTVLAGRATIKLTEVDRVRAWEFCRRVRSAILAERSRTHRAR